MNNSFQRILVLAPHTDDGEFGCGGSIYKYCSIGNEVMYVAFSSAEDSVPDYLSKDILKKEVVKATDILGIKKTNLVIYDYKVRNFPECRQSILDEMIKINNDFKPSLVFLPSTFDTHQDHKTIAEEGFRAFKKTTIYGYEVPWNNLTFSTNGFIILSDESVNIKIKALECYKSQSFRDYASANYIRSLAHSRGIQIGTKYAEAFQIIRSVLK